MFVSELFLNELSSWKQHALKGEVSNKGLMKLTKAGVRKPVLNKLAGIQNGIDAKLKKAGATKSSSKIEDEYDDRSNVYFVPRTKTGKIVSHSPHDKKEQDQTGTSDDHEANEARETRKKINKGIKSDEVEFFNKGAPTMIFHSNPKVLKDEYKTRDQLLSQYPHLKNQKTIKPDLEYRHDSGETDYVRSHTNAQLNRVANKLDKYSLKKQKIDKELSDTKDLQNIKNKVYDKLKTNPVDNASKLKKQRTRMDDGIKKLDTISKDYKKANKKSTAVYM